MKLLNFLKHGSDRELDLESWSQNSMLFTNAKYTLTK